MFDFVWGDKNNNECGCLSHRRRVDAVNFTDYRFQTHIDRSANLESEAGCCIAACSWQTPKDMLDFVIRPLLLSLTPKVKGKERVRDGPGPLR